MKKSMSDMEQQVQKLEEEKEEEEKVLFEIDTSAPFESVKEAVTLFGTFGYWRNSNSNSNNNNNNNNLPLSHSISHQSCLDEFDVATVEEEAKHLETHLFIKERETLQILKQLETTKLVMEDLKLNLLKQESGVTVNSDHNVLPAVNQAQLENDENCATNTESLMSSPYASSAPNLILEQLQQAKVNLTRTTADLACIRATVELYSKKIEKERLSLEKTRERLALKSSKISNLEQELNQTAQILQLAKTADTVQGSADTSTDVSMGLQQLNSETEEFKKIGEAARTEVLRAVSEIEQTKLRIKTAEISLVAAKKMKEAARAAEAVALAEIKVLSKNESASGDVSQKPETVTLSSEEYSSLIQNARDAEEQANKRVIDAMLHVDEANVSKMGILQRIEEAAEEVKSSKKALEEALNRVEAANKGKLAVEDTLRQWRSEHGHKRRIVHNSTKFKNPYPTQHRRESYLLDVNGQNPASNGSSPALKPTLSIGQILSRKLRMPEEEFETGSVAERSNVKRKVSLGQMLHKQHYGELTFARDIDRENCHRQFSAKRKKFGFSKFSLHLNKQSKKKKQPTLDLR